MPVEELIKTFYEQSGFKVNQIEHQNYDKKGLKILRFSAEKQNLHRHNYLITIVKTPYNNIILTYSPPEAGRHPLSHASEKEP